MANCVYEVRVSFVDTTYWDDGSRWTSRTFKYGKRKEAIAFAQEASIKGCKVRGQNGVLHVWPGEDDVTVERISRAKVDWAAQPVAWTP